MGTTSDPNDPGLSKIGPDGMQETYYVLTEAERRKGFIRPVRKSYLHTVCGKVTTMGTAIAETYARAPHTYGATYCATCQDHYRVGEHGQFLWVGTTEKVGT